MSKAKININANTKTETNTQTQGQGQGPHGSHGSHGSHGAELAENKAHAHTPGHDHDHEYEHDQDQDQDQNQEQERERRIKTLLYLADGQEFLQLSDKNIYEDWKAFLYEVLCEMEDFGLLRSIITYPSRLIGEKEYHKAQSVTNSNLNLNDVRVGTVGTVGTIGTINIGTVSPDKYGKKSLSLPVIYSAHQN